MSIQTIIPGANFDPSMMVKLAMRPKDHDPDTFATVMSTLFSSKNIYDRGLAAWAVGRLLQLQSKHDQYYLKKQILDQSGPIMDALVDIIGDSKELSSRVAAMGSELSVSSSSTTTVYTPSPKKRTKKKGKSPSSYAPTASSTSAVASLSDAGPLLSVTDCNRISKNCSLIIIMLSNYLSDIDGDPYTFQPPPTPLHRMAATPEVKVTNDDGVNSDKKKKMQRNRRKFRQTQNAKALEVSE